MWKILFWSTDHRPVLQNNYLHKILTLSSKLQTVRHHFVKSRFQTAWRFHVNSWTPTFKRRAVSLAPRNSIGKIPWWKISRHLFWSTDHWPVLQNKCLDIFTPGEKTFGIELLMPCRVYSSSCRWWCDFCCCCCCWGRGARARQEMTGACAWATYCAYCCSCLC